MESTDDQIIEKHAKQCRPCLRNTLRPYEYEFTCFAFGDNVIKRKNELLKIQRKRMNFFNRLKFAEHKIFCICIEVYNIYEGNNFDKIYEALSTIKKK